ncbi:CaiB/BaiF CoA transferase family protein [Tardiphaga sp. 803_E3_N1_3]|uniref:CaiB/BaiF CoA transferase family protein n=1 Tax=Tardiphaga sp. 803_E3_N1_3 TaxID=3240785 RepID=UPI003F24B1B0
MTGPLQGVRVLDLTTMLSGPCAAQTLAEMGAEVTKVETPEGDNLRNIGVSVSGKGMGPMHLHANRGKRSVALDLKSEMGRSAFLALAKDSDVLICNVRTKAMQRLGLGYDDVRAVNPSIIYISIVGYGGGGPYSDRPAYDDLIQAAVGIPSLGASLEGGARYAPIAVADRVTGMNAANAALGALYHRLRTGEGQHVEVGMFETMAFMVLSDHMAGRTYEPPLGPTVFERYASVRRPFPTVDGVVCLMLVSDKQWKAFFNLVGLDDVLKDERFSTVASRTRNTNAIYDIVAEVVATRPTDWWLQELERIDIPAVRLATIDSLIDDPHLKAIGFFDEIDHPTEGRIRAMRSTGRWSATQPSPERPAPLLGEHTAELVQGEGLSKPEKPDIRHTA